MPCCEKCWGDAYLRSLSVGKDQADCYKDLLRKRKDNPCSPQEQAGQFWDDEKGCDRRSLLEKMKSKTI